MPSALLFRLTWLNLPAALLLGLLQRTPVVRVVAAAADRLTAAPFGAMIRAATVSAASLGTLHSLAGATVLVTNQPSPLSATVGVAVSPVAFGINGPGVGQPGSWEVGGVVPPGLNFSGLTAPGTVNVANLVLSGTPTTGGNYTVTLRGWENKGARGAGSPTYTYSINVAGGAATVAPTFTSHPSGQTITAGGSVTMTAAASGTPTPTYQWAKDGTALGGATTASYTINSARTTDAGTYTVVATNSVSSVTSNPAQLTVTAPNVAPQFTLQPLAQTVTVGASVNFSATASGTPTPTYQWAKDGTALVGATTASYTITSARTTDAGTYTVVATNSVSSVTSNPAQLTVTTLNVAPQFTKQPQAQTVTVGATVNFSATASGTPTPTYQWSKNGNVLAGATAATYTIASVALTDAGTFAVVATNAAGTATSNAVALTVNSAGVTPTDYGRLVNLSILTTAGTGANVLTMGAVIGGAGSTGSLPLVIRAVGPTLGTAFNLAGVLADPVMTINAQGATAPLAVNDNWDGSAATRAAFTAVGAFALTAGSLDCAYVPPAPGFQAGGYTVQVAGTTSAAGLVIAEIYDAAGAARTATMPRLINLSTLAQIDPGATLAVGFVIGGTAPCRVLVRAIGPTLGTAFGLGGVMADPGFVLFSNDSGQQIGANDDWGGTAALTGAMSSVGAFALGDPASRDAGLVATLLPGTYSVRVSGKNATGGLALVEVYEAR